MNIDWSQLITQEQKDLDAANQLREAQNREARDYLASTDWYVVRLQETGEPIPENVSALRQEARDKVIHEVAQ